MFYWPYAILYVQVFNGRKLSVWRRLWDIRRENSEDFAGKRTVDLFKVRVLGWRQIALNNALALIIAILMSYIVDLFIHLDFAKL